MHGYACGVTVTTAEWEIGKPGSNSGLVSCIHILHRCSWERHVSISSPFSYEGQTRLSLLEWQSIYQKENSVENATENHSTILRRIHRLFTKEKTESMESNDYLHPEGI